MLDNYRFKQGAFVLLPDEVANKTASGLFLQQDKFRQVVRTGKVVKSDDEFVPVGSTVHHEPYAYKELVVDDVTYRVITREAIIAVQVDTEE